MPQAIPSTLAEVERLRERIREAEAVYYGASDRIVSDAVFDDMMKTLATAESKHPDWITENSPTMRVGGSLDPQRARVPHSAPVLSLDNADAEGVERFVARSEEAARRTGIPAEATVEWKLDGVCLVARYRDGQLDLALSRGDGKQGEIVTENARTIRSLPLQVQASSLKEGSGTWAKAFEVRGEVVVSKDDFRLLNAERQAKGLKPRTNERSTASGAVRQSDPRKARDCRLDFIAWGLLDERGKPVFDSQEKSLEWLEKAGFMTAIIDRNMPVSKACLEKVAETAERSRDGYPFLTDGIVVKLDSEQNRAALGEHSKAPRWGVAIKPEAGVAVTKLLGIDVQVGRTGSLTPVARLKPVSIGGVTIASATLHNEQEIRRLGVQIGDEVEVQRAGEVIPQVTAKAADGNPRTPFRMPGQCPRCATKTIQPQGEIKTRCPNESCPARVSEWIRHFSSRQAVYIAGLGPQIIDKLVNSGIVTEPSALYSLDRKQLAQAGIQGKTASNLLASIEASKDASLEQVFVGCGIRHAAGGGTARRCGKAFGTIEKVMAASVEELAAVEDIGPVVAASVHGFFAEPRHQAMIARFQAAGMAMPSSQQPARPAGAPPDPNLPLAGMTFAITGTLAGKTRDVARQTIESLGGAWNPGPSRGVDYLLAGEKAGSKIAKAEKLGIPVIDEQEMDRIADGRWSR